MINSRQLVVSITIGMLCLNTGAEAQRGRGGGGFRGGGGMSRGGARTSVSRPSGGQIGGNFNRPSGNFNRPSDGTINRGDINRGNINVDRGNMNVYRPVNIGDGDFDNIYGRPGCCYHPLARAAAWTTAAAVGSVVYALPPNCTVVVVNGLTYQQCGSTWYQPQFVGDEASYVVVSPPD
jgi:hypothetical protein